MKMRSRHAPQRISNPIEITSIFNNFVNIKKNESNVTQT